MNAANERQPPGERYYPALGLTARPRYVVGSSFAVRDGPDRPRIAGYEELPMCYCPARCGGFRFQAAATEPCRGKATCFYTRVIYQRNLVARCPYVDTCRTCGSAFVRPTRRPPDGDSHCWAAKCAPASHAEDNQRLSADQAPCVVCDAPNASRRVDVATTIIPDVFPDDLFAAERFPVCASDQCYDALLAAAAHFLADRAKALTEDTLAAPAPATTNDRAAPSNDDGQARSSSSATASTPSSSSSGPTTDAATARGAAIAYLRSWAKDRAAS
jgi:hypothetical protein